MPETAPESTAAKSDSTESASAKNLMEVMMAGAIALAKDSDSYDQATEQFEALLGQIEADNPTATPLLRQLWKEFIAGRRSAAFWETMSDAERGLSEKMAASTIQLKQNYMRLIQEQ